MNQSDERAAQRRAIDAVLAEDARRHPPFAMARRCAVLALIEQNQGSAIGSDHLSGLGSTLEALHEYERRRGGWSAPSKAALSFGYGALSPCEILAYERGRPHALPTYARAAPGVLPAPCPAPEAASHEHHCTECYDDFRCSLPCTIVDDEGDLPRGGHDRCPACRSFSLARNLL